MNDETETQSLQFTLGLTIAPKQKILLQYLQDLSVENGSKTIHVLVQILPFCYRMRRGILFNPGAIPETK